MTSARSFISAALIGLALADRKAELLSESPEPH